MKTVIICAHGLIKDADHDFVELKKYVDDNEIDIEVDLVRLYDIKDKKTFKHKNKVKVLENEILKYENEGYRIILVGYSFSCGLVAKMCKKHNIYKVIIVSPVCHIVTKSGLGYYLKTFLKAFKLKWKVMFNKKKKKTLKRVNSFYIVDLLFSCFYDLHKTNRKFKYINCPVFCMIGTEDEIVRLKDLKNIRKQIKKSPYFDMKFYQGEDHVFIMSKKHSKDRFYNDMIDFVNYSQA